MQVQDISVTQIVVVLLFLGALIVLQQLLKNNKFSFQSHLNKKRRIKFIDEFALSNSERIRLIRVDNKEYLYFFVKGSQPTIIPHEGKNTSTIKQNIELSLTYFVFFGFPKHTSKFNHFLFCKFYIHFELHFYFDYFLT